MAQRILIIGSQKLIGEAIRSLLEKEGFQVLDVMVPDDEALARVSNLPSDVDALIVVEGSNAAGETPFTARLLQRDAGVPVIRVGVEGDRISVYETYQVPARCVELVTVIRKLPDRGPAEVTDP